MKKVKNYAGNFVDAYQDEDLVSKMPIIKAAEYLWYQNWLDNGGVDEGTCCGGKAIQVYYIGKGKRKLSVKSIVPCSFVQGNLPAAKSVQPVLDYLAANGIKAFYYDGWMD
jgi:hypothetical protein